MARPHLTEPNPRIPSLLGCGGLLLLLLGMITGPFVGAFIIDITDAGLVMGDESYGIGEIWWLVGPLGVVSVVAVLRLSYGQRDWLAAAIAAVWTAIAAGYAVGTAQYGFLTLTALTLLLIAGGTWQARREMGRAA